MTTEGFNTYLREMQSMTSETLIRKAEEYATGGDRLHNFKVAAGMQGCTMLQALGGMMSKHTVSIYDMIGSGQPYDRALWAEKIQDHINYLYLLWAAVNEDVVPNEDEFQV